ncbi:MAG: phosphonate C-P lyase system protein PhnL [Rhizobiales bacterium]|nr:phosphonate C-P lyase system protein PhnL [Hyphomicrobiales bacterium]
MGARAPAIEVHGLAKTFVMHLQGGIRLPVLSGVSFDVRAGECVVLAGPSGVGKSSILRMIYGNYRADGGSIMVADGTGGRIDVVSAAPRQIVALRRSAIGYVSQFLSVIPRVSALELVAAVAVEQGTSEAEAKSRACDLLSRLNIPERLWGLAPATFSCGERQRVNIARGFIGDHGILLLDEPTASLDAENRAVVVAMVAEKKKAGVAMLGIFHDGDVRAAAADRAVDVSGFAAGRAA